MDYDVNIRSPGNIFLFFGLIFSTFLFVSVSVKADVIMKGDKNFPSYSFHESYNGMENIHKLNVLLENAKKEGYNILICSGASYNSSYYKNLKPYWILISSEALNYDGVNFYTNDSSTCKYFHCTLVVSDTDEYSNVNNFSNSNFEFETNFSSKISKQYYPTVLYYNFPSGLNVVNNADTNFFPESLVEYDKNDLNSYPYDTINVTSPVDNIKTNNKYYPFVFRGKIKLDDNNIEESVTPQIISKFIRKKFKYDFSNSDESYTSLSSLGVFEIDKGDSSYNDFILIDKILDGKITFHNESYPVDCVDDFVCGVSGNYSSWNSKGYYNFIINTSIYVGDNISTNNYKFYFTVPYKFNGIFSYKTIEVDYQLDKNLYIDDNLDGVDDSTGEIIPSTATVSTVDPPVDDGIDDGWEVVQNQNSIFSSFINEINSLSYSFRSFVTTTSTTIKVTVESTGDLLKDVKKWFDFFPSPVPQMIVGGLSLMIFVSIVGFIRGR